MPRNYYNNGEMKTSSGRNKAHEVTKSAGRERIAKLPSKKRKCTFCKKAIPKNRGRGYFSAIE